MENKMSRRKGLSRTSVPPSTRYDDDNDLVQDHLKMECLTREVLLRRKEGCNLRIDWTMRLSMVILVSLVIHSILNKLSIFISSRLSMCFPEISVVILYFMSNRLSKETVFLSYMRRPMMMTTTRRVITMIKSKWWPLVFLVVTVTGETFFLVLFEIKWFYVKQWSLMKVYEPEGN